jgi:hypothetical protein
MTATFELICHHVYSGWDGLPVDLSDHDNHGQAIDTQFLKDGVVPNSGALRFWKSGSRVYVPASNSWRSLGGIKVEVTARRRITPILVDDHQTLIAGDNSFSLFISNHSLFASFRGTSTYPLQNSDGLNSMGSPGFQEYLVPYGKWVTLGFTHDGFDTMELYADGQLIARRTNLLGTVPSVGPLGVSIGNQPKGDGSHWDGDIDEVKVWRLNPHLMDEKFFSRPVSNEVAECWARFFRSLAKALEHDPECARQVQAAMRSALDRIPRMIMRKGPETRARYFRTCYEYLQLWRAGKLDTPEMVELCGDWCAWLRLVGASFRDNPVLKILLQSDCLKKIVADCQPLKCDPQFEALVRGLVNYCGESVAPEGQSYAP